MRVVVLGGDGFCGWPTALHLKAAGHDVKIIDDLSRRAIDKRIGIESLTPIASSEARQAASGIEIRVLDVSLEAMTLRGELDGADAVIHFAQQRSAPYSMRSLQNRHYTVSRNIRASMNVLNAVYGTDAHLIHLGTAGVYGYSGAGESLPEGWIDWHGEERLHPFKPGSIYHATKCMDAILFEFVARNDGLRITDLHQGIVWGTQTAETAADVALINRFDWDGDFGTVLNRFVMQAAIGHPLTVHGSGGQTRGFIHIEDTVKCVRLALETPAKPGEYRVFNQIAETLRVADLAHMVAKQTGAIIQNVDNPRNEADANDLAADNAGLRSLGWDPILVVERLLPEIFDLAERYADRVERDQIPATAKW